MDELLNRAYELLDDASSFLDLFEGEREEELNERIYALLTDIDKYYKWK